MFLYNVDYSNDKAGILLSHIWLKVYIFQSYHALECNYTDRHIWNTVFDTTNEILITQCKYINIHKSALCVKHQYTRTRYETLTDILANAIIWYKRHYTLDTIMYNNESTEKKCLMSKKKKSNVIICFWNQSLSGQIKG